MKKFLLALGMASCLLGLTACSQDNQSADTAFMVSYDEESFKNNLQDEIEQVAAGGDVVTQSDGEASFVEALRESQSEIGTIEGLSDWQFSVSDDGEFVVEVFVDGSIRDMKLKVVYEDSLMEYATLNVQYSLGEKMSKAAINTVIGMCVVFVVLILISFIISLFKYISVFEQKLKEGRSGAQKDTSSVDHTIAQIVQKEEELVDDLELVAVIAAAIAASEGTSPDGLVVRSIRKVNKNKWQNA
jgi:sodium pump decarboxylase gamma subunit